MIVEHLVSRSGLLVAATGFLLSLSSPAFSAAGYYDMASTCSGVTPGTKDYSTCTVTVANQTTMTASGWSNANSATTAGSRYFDATLYRYASGLGVINDHETPSLDGEHALDNKFANDAMLFYFHQKSNITKLTIGWDGTDNGGGSTSSAAINKYNDSDLAIYYWDAVAGGAAKPTWGGTSNPEIASPTSSMGWKLVGNYCDVGGFTTGSGNDTVTLASSSICDSTRNYSATTYSSYWLVTGYQPTTARYDAFKVMGLHADRCTVNCGTVSEPGTLALMGVAALGLFGARRRRASIG